MRGWPGHCPDLICDSLLLLPLRLDCVRRFPVILYTIADFSRQKFNLSQRVVFTQSTAALILVRGRGSRILE